MELYRKGTTYRHIKCSLPHFTLSPEAEENVLKFNILQSNLQSTFTNIERSECVLLKILIQTCSYQRIFLSYSLHFYCLMNFPNVR